MVMRPEPIAVVVVAPARAVPAVREILDALGPPLVRSTAVERLAESVAPVVAAARAATPSRGVVAVVSSESDADAAIAAGADEVLVEPLGEATLACAVRRAALRAGVRDLAATEARMLEQVIEGVAHAVEGPLAALALDVDALRSGALSTPGDGSDGALDEVDAALDECSSAVEHVAQVVRDATMLASRAPSEANDAVAVRPLLDHVIRALGSGAALRAHVEIQSDDELPLVSAPRRLLARTLARLLLQALDAICDGDAEAMRRLRITVRATPDAVALMVEVRAALDSPPPSSRFVLGLDGRLGVVREALRTFDGELVAERATDAEARFVAFLPRVESRTSPGVARAVGPDAPRRPRPRVLVVDRDERVLRASVRALSERFDVVVAISGEAALALAREEHVDLAVVDVRLPDMSILAFVDELQRAAPALGGRVALVGREGDVPTPSELPILAKPVRRTSLLETLDALLVSPPQGGSLPVRVLN